MFSDLLNETKGLKYQITLKLVFKKFKSTEIGFASVYFNSAKTVINHKFSLEKAFQEILGHLKRLKNIDLHSELPFYEELNIIKTYAFTAYAMSYKVELVQKKKDPVKQLEASKSNIKDLFSDLLNEQKA